MSETEVADRPVTAGAHASAGRGLAVWLLTGGLIGFVAALVLAVEKYALLADPTYVPTCSLNPVLSCGSIMASAHAEASPSPIRCLVSPASRCRRHRRRAARRRAPGRLVLGRPAGGSQRRGPVRALLTFASPYRIGALCPYCMFVWAVTIPLFTAVTLRNLTAWVSRLPSGVNTAVTALRTRHSVLLTAWLLLIVAAITQRFWLYWSTLVG